jgi:exodeoxyribonuclease VII large subunit
MRHHPQEQLAYAKKRCELNSKQLTALMQALLKNKQSQLRSSIRQLDALSPLKVMARGYSLVYDEQEQRLIKSVNDAQLGDLVRIKVSDGQLSCQVWGMKEDGQG